MKILIFIEGTTLVHKFSQGKSREEIIQQVKDNDPSIDDYQNYVPIKDAVQSIQKFIDQGHQICYITSRRTGIEISQIRNVLNKYSFPKGELFYRQKGEEYKDVVLRIKPDLIIEDDCESIGGYEETIKYQMKDSEIEFVIIEEFGGIDYLNIWLFE